MRKRLITPIPQAGTLHEEGWLDLDRIAVVEVTSEEKDYPVEAALVAGEMRGWRAADSGGQTIRLLFDQPQRLTRIALVFEETETERTQEFVLRWCFHKCHHDSWLRLHASPQVRPSANHFQEKHRIRARSGPYHSCRNGMGVRIQRRPRCRSRGI
jgi:hypothetical protein